ncbi:transposase [Streptomyces sp. NPDC005336]|uniref:transposase n=1 Tax=Streptomyces sp. NPDC005336 TaxID=3157035 RepID=UPI0033A4CC74
MSKRYTPEFRRDAVELVRSSGRNVTEVARELGVSAEGLRGWVKQAKADRGEGPAGALTSDEREELRRVRRELAEVKKANEILVKAAAFFAKEIVK